ncbi:MAG: hypothetical protein K2W99_07820 [Chthoniobacterales bacterium]|nr:hypothetical protein [Chthoniobacterales bacterium]
MSVLTIQLSPFLKQQLKALVKSQGKTEEFYVTKTLEEYLPFVEQASLSAKPSSRTPEEAARIGKAIEEAKRLREEIRLTTGRISLKELKEMAEEGRA